MSTQTDTLKNTASFELAAGTIAGRDHIGRRGVLKGMNNQDAVLVRLNEHALVAVVCDGCGSRPHSEVGAKIGAGLIVASVLDRSRSLSRDSPPQQNFWDEVAADVVAELRALALALTRGGRSYNGVVQENFLFTAIGILATDSHTTVFGAGDGVYAINGTVTELNAPGNMPPYLGYALLPPGTYPHEDLLGLRALATIETQDLNNWLIGSDGVSDLIAAEGKQIPGMTATVQPLENLWTDDRFYSNPDALRRMLALANREVASVDRASGQLNIRSGLLRDDTTMVVGRRKDSILDHEGHEVHTKARRDSPQ